ncbi:unnamed protein product [Hyaloperonospora brassicae]|uniref:RanBP2-type domain-containing protein n=1 Tax=Hyaloperonospora brassicae TaxID=162125 RepID=A0AAV0UU95_HYABA|nr:unnamed protein product [Hyaloperonospora brassicae]
MRPSLSSSTTTPNRGEKGCNEECLHHRRRRADSAPFTASKRQKTDDNDARRGDREPARAPASGFFVRLARYIPIVNRFVAEEDVGTNVDLDVGADAGVDDDTDDVESSVLETCGKIQTAQENLGEEGEGRGRDGGEDGGEDEKRCRKRLCQWMWRRRRRCSNSNSSKDTLEDAVDVSVPPVTRSTLPAGQGKKKFATRLSPPLKCRRSPPCESKQEKESSSAVMDQVRRIREKREGLFGSSRPPQTPNAAGTQERQVPTSPSPLDVARKIIKEKKKISLDEFERLQHQLHELVGTTPHEQLTQAYLLMDLGLLVTPSCPGVKSELSFVPSSIAAQNRGRSAARSEQKRESGDEVKSDMPSGKRPRTHETEPVRRPGATQHGLLTREERRLRKPRSSPLLPRRDAATSKMCSDALARNIILVLNKVQSPPAEEALKPTPSTTVSGTSRSATAASTDAPAPSSSQVTSMTSASTPTRTVLEQQEMETIGGLGVILPIGVEGIKHAGADDKDTRVRFVFSPSPSMREPPVKVLNQKTTKDDGKKSVAAEEATKLSADMPAVTPAASLSGAANPLARFMQLKPGQWKCTRCRVLNEATSGRCPCCGTARSDGGSAAKARTALLETTEKCPLTGLSFGTTTEATAAADKGTATPAAGSITPALTSFSTASSPQPMESTAFCWAPSTTSFGTASSAFGPSSSGGADSSATAGGFGSTSAAAPSTPYGSSTSSLQAAPPFLFGGFSQAQTATTPTNTQPTLAFSSGFGNGPPSLHRRSKRWIWNYI